MKKVCVLFAIAAFLIMIPAPFAGAMQTSSKPQPVGITKKVLIEANEFVFKPATLRLKKGESVALTVRNKGKLPHRFTMAELHIDTGMIMSGKEKMFRFTVPIEIKSGTYRAVCNIPGHTEAGMVAKIIVN
ncbi:MAG: cupredoxin domain-containing protein [Candidatus Sungbacteria bacterium]|nr:cupredoxin domain-containing protein [bacterium]MDZ4285394.1 cupredoxin domain-containing protein [Candidatus Sungbacteria bacterium]